jgi:hypothetical protein
MSAETSVRGLVQTTSAPPGAVGGLELPSGDDPGLDPNEHGGVLQGHPRRGPSGDDDAPAGLGRRVELVGLEATETPSMARTRSKSGEVRKSTEKSVSRQKLTGRTAGSACRV